MANKEQLGELITLEQGKPLKEAIGEVRSLLTYFNKSNEGYILSFPLSMTAISVNLQVSLGASYLEFYAEEAKRIYGDIIPSTSADRRLFILKQVNYYTRWRELSYTLLAILFADGRSMMYYAAEVLIF